MQKKVKLEEPYHRPNTFMETCQFQLHYFSIGYEWKMERENWKSNFKTLLSPERKMHFKIWKKDPNNQKNPLKTKKKNPPNKQQQKKETKNTKQQQQPPHRKNTQKTKKNPSKNL